MTEEEPKRPREEGAEQVWTEVGRHAGWGIQIAVSIGLFFWLGSLADERVGTTPWLSILGAFVGGGAGFYSMFRHVVGDAEREAASDDGEEGREDHR